MEGEETVITCKVKSVSSSQVESGSITIKSRERILSSSKSLDPNSGMDKKKLEFTYKTRVTPLWKDSGEYNTYG